MDDDDHNRLTNQGVGGVSKKEIRTGGCQGQGSVMVTSLMDTKMPVRKSQESTN